MSINNPAPAASSVIESSTSYTRIGVRITPSSDYDYSGAALAIYTTEGSLVDWVKVPRSFSDQQFMVIQGLTPGTEYIVKIASLDDFIYLDNDLILEGLKDASDLLNFESLALETKAAPVIESLANVIEQGPFDATNVQLETSGYANVVKVVDELGAVLFDGEYSELINFSSPIGSKTLTITYYSLGETGSDIVEYVRDLDVTEDATGYLDSIDLKFDSIEVARPDVNEILEEVSQDINEVVTRYGEINAVIRRVDTIVTDNLAETITAVSILEGQVNDPANNNSALYQSVQQAQLSADGNASSITVLQGQVNDPANNSSALYQLVQQAQSAANGNASSVSTLLSGVTGEGVDADALVKLEAYFNDGGLGARAFFGTNVDNQVTGMIVDDDGVERVIEFLAGNVRFVDENSNLKVYYDLNIGEYVFDGKIIARSGQFEGEITSNSGVIGGWHLTSGYMISSLSSSSNRISLNSGTSTIYLLNSSGQRTGEWSPSRFKAGLGSDYLEWTSSGGLKVSGRIEGSDFIGGSINIGGGNFTVNSSGVMYAASGTFAGNLSAAGGTFNGTLNVKSSSSGARLEIVNNRISVFDSSNTLRVRIGRL